MGDHIDREQTIRVRNPEEAAKGRMIALHQRGITSTAEPLPNEGVRIQWLIEQIEASTLAGDVRVCSTWRRVDYVKASA